MKRKLIIPVLLLLTMASCKKYEDFATDFNYTTAYFAYQNPVRTVFSDNLEIEVGALMAGRRENNKNETISYRIAPELLTNTSIVGTKVFKLLPADYYTLSSPGTLTIPSGEFLGKATLKLDASKFLSDPSALSNTYALPLLITGTTLDSVLVGNAAGVPRKDYTIIVVKYISQFHGVYYQRGLREKYDQSGTLVNVLKYVADNEESEYVKNRVWNLNTINANTLVSTGVGENLSVTGKNYSLNLSVAADAKVSILNNPASLIKNITDLGNSRYDAAKKSMYLNYQYIGDDNMRYVMKDTLNFRNDGLKLELW